MSFRSIAAGLVLFLTGTAPLRAQAPLDFIPPDAIFAAVIRNPDELRKKGDKLAQESGLNPQIRPSQLLPLAYLVMGVNAASVDETKPFAIVCVNPKAIGAQNDVPKECLTVAFPVKTVEAMAGNFGLSKDDLKPGKIVEVKKFPGLLGNNTPACAVLNGNHCHIGFHQKALEQVIRTKGLSGELKVNQRKLLGNSDGLLHLGTEAWGEMWTRFLRDVESGFDVAQDDAEKKTAKELLAALGSVRFGMMAFRLEGGLGLSFLSVFPKDGNEAAKKFLSAVRGGEGASSLAGLPDGNAVAIQAARGEGTKNGHIARILFRVAVQRFLEPGKFFGTSDRSSLMNLFGEIWQRLQGSRMALYKTAHPAELGLFSLVGILDTEDAGKFLAELRQLAKLGSADGIDLKTEAGKRTNEAEIEKLIADLGARRFALRESAERKLELAGEPVLPYLDKALKSSDIDVSRRAERIKREIVKAAEARRKELLSRDLTRGLKPSFAFLDRTEKAEGYEVKLIAVKLPKRDAAAAPQLAKLFGPDWNKVRVAVVGNQVAVLVGSDLNLFKAALKNLADGKPGLASSKLLAAQAKKTDPGRKLEMHFSTQMAMALLAAEDLDKPAKAAGLPLSTVTLSVEPDRVQTDIWLPMEEVKVLLKAFGW